MKRAFISIFTIALAIAAGTVRAEAALPTSGPWNATTITEDETVNLTGNVSVNGRITVSSGIKLIINYTGSESISITNHKDGLAGIFSVQEGATLEIHGGSAGLYINGGSAYEKIETHININGKTYTDPSLFVVREDGTSMTMTEPAIINNGILICDKVNFSNINNVNESLVGGSTTMQLTHTGGAVRHGNNGALLTKLSNCNIHQCRAVAGAGGYVASQSDGQVVIENCNFGDCICFANAVGAHGGVVRGYGNSAANIFLTGTRIHHCYSNVDAGAVYFPSNGINTKGTDDYPATNKEAKLTIDGCEFNNNRAMASSGALDICANMDIVGGTTKVYNNRAEGTSTAFGATGRDFGGGMSLRAYNSNAPAASAVTINYNINSKLKVYDNVAKVRGGGIAVFAESDTTLEPGSNIFINFDGAEVYGNKTIGNDSGYSYGGGVWIKDDTDITRNYTFTLNLDSGSIHDNSAYQGGGLYINRWTINSKSGGTVKIKDNIAENDGGGIFVTSGSSPSDTTVLRITPTGTSFGFHSNVADKGGNEIVAQGVNTYVTLPKVSKMELSGFERENAGPNWYEDYNAADANYSQGLNLDEASNARYADQLTANTYLKHLVIVPGEENRVFHNQYICYTLGYELLRIIIKGTGMDEGDNALVKVKYIDGNGAENIFNVLLVSDGSTSVSKTVKNLNYGHYDVTLMDGWSWKYSAEPVSYSEDLQTESEKTFEFVFTKKEDKKSILSDESIVVNEVSKTAL